MVFPKGGHGVPKRRTWSLRLPTYHTHAHTAAYTYTTFRNAFYYYTEVKQMNINICFNSIEGDVLNVPLYQKYKGRLS